MLRCCRSDIIEEGSVEETNIFQTHGLVEIFDRGVFWRSLKACYTTPWDVHPSTLCLIYMVLAIGLAMATPNPGTREDNVIRRLRSNPIDLAEALFRTAKHFGDPLSGFEHADFWSVQAFCLMSIYTLAVSKRNAAYAYYGELSDEIYSLL